ncbi:ABC transporter permease [Brachybacterium sp. JHP9]|uniref:ABC transporter permease n=1 Tax=Brachybacterium equifaecis TaxID=2910770 RepID=A0ABT0R1Z0_9MICO|nr:ABC transporter permease [Brachybacterium equifaecis]MCL6423259.1 ABC transporter permease [Brachybacterium equifaecis]
MTALIASLVEAYGELRVNGLRILLALLGVAFSVFTLTATLGAGGMLGAAIQQSNEASNGRPAIVTVQASDTTSSTRAERDAAVAETFDVMGIEQRSRRASLPIGIQTLQGVMSMQITAVDPAYAEMYRVRPDAGRWLADSDQDRLAPAIVVNQTAYATMGRPDLGSEAVDLYGGEAHSTAIVIGVVPDSQGPYPMAYTAVGSAAELPGIDESAFSSQEYLAWIPPEMTEQISNALTTRLSSTPTGTYNVYSNYWPGSDDPFRILSTALIAIAAVILILGAMGLLNIALVTVRYRVREIGIRRSYGATGGRIFFGVLMESVVATVIAGIVGVLGAVALVRSPMVLDYFKGVGLVDLPPFPASAVITGLVAATAVGILAGALPALIATRIKVIDAIRS